MKKRLIGLCVLMTAVLCLVACRKEAPAPETAPEQTQAAVTAPETEPVPAETEPEEEDTVKIEKKEPWGRTVQMNGKTWRYNSRLRTVLFMGIDTKSTVTKGEAFGDGGRADMIALFVMDPDSKTTQLIEMSRDTITIVDAYNKDRKLLYSGKMQINMQHAFSDSAARGAMLMKNKVSEVLYGLPIDSYFSMSLDGIQAAVKLMGGITLKLEDDWTDIDPTYKAGETIRMDAKAVERFLRYRDTEITGSNDTRMERHGWFIRQMFKQLSKTGGIGVQTMLDKLDPYIETNMDGDTIKNLTSFKFNDEILKVPGGTVDGKYHDEFYIDEEALQKLLLKEFYREAD